ncbi:LexA family protein [Pseudomonas aeruginosa]
MLQQATITSLDELMSLRSPTVFLARVSGMSMAGAGIFDGDILVVDRLGEAVSGSVVIATLNGGATVKRYCLEDGRIVLRPENTRCAPIYVMEGDDFEIWGLVTFSLHRYRAADLVA